MISFPSIQHNTLRPGTLRERLKVWRELHALASDKVPDALLERTKQNFTHTLDVIERHAGVDG
jgi:hypothetical protein